MSKHEIKLKRSSDVRGFLASNELMSDAMTAIHTIPGVEDVWEMSEHDGIATVGYTWVGKEPFMQTEEVLIKFGLTRAD